MEKQELHCHDCGKYVQFEIDLTLNGNHVLECPNCGHEHCRKVENGVITDIRWDSRNSKDNVIMISTVTTTYSTVSTYNQYLNSPNSRYQYGTPTSVTVSRMGTPTSASSIGTTADTIMYSSWLNSTLCC
jgi:DNA-directed RNA polymerase subunit RPC12/RpoP